MRLEGYIDGCDHARVWGWVRDLDAPERPVSLIVTCRGELLARGLANAFRADLQAAFGGTGRSSFAFDISGRLSPLDRNVLEVTTEIDGTHLIHSPFILEGSGCFDEATKTAITRVLEGVHTERDVDERLAFLAERTDGLLAAYDRLRSRRTERAARGRVKWHTAGEPLPQAAREPAARKASALVVDTRVPVVERDAGSVAVLSHTLCLQRLGYDVTFLPADLASAGSSLERYDVTCLARPWYACVEEALARHAGEFDLVYLHRVEVAGPYGPLVRRYQPNARVVFSLADLGSLRIWRQAEVERRAELRSYSGVLAAQETAVGHAADAVITHSSYEASILRERLGAGKVHLVPFSVPERATPVPWRERGGLAFIGSFDHAPNADAARWLAEVILPKVAETHPGIVCRFVGSALPDHLRRLASETIVAQGAVDDLSTVFDSVRLTIAPLAYGAGVKGKVLSSLAAGIPCVCTPVAAEGLDLPPLLQSLVASEPDALAALVVRLHEDEDLNARCATLGLDYIADRASDEATDRAMRQAVAVRSLAD